MPDTLSALLLQGSFVTSGIGILLFLYFACAYALPAARLRRTLETLSDKIKLEASVDDAPVTQPDKIAPLFAAVPEWQEAWAEYERTLNVTRMPDESITEIKSAAPAASFTGFRALVETPLETEYFRSLPAILAFFGFAALAMTLGGAYLDAGAPKEIADIQEAMQSIQRDPRISGAVLLALATVIFSIGASGIFRTSTAPLAPFVEQITQMLDALYAYGGESAPEDVMPRVDDTASEPETLVIAAPPAPPPPPEPAQTLEDVLTVLFARQAASFEAATANIGAEISKSIAQALEKPLGQLLKASETSTMQTERIGKVLQETVSSMGKEVSKSVSVALDAPMSRMVAVVEQSGRQAENVDRVLQGTMSSIVKKIEATFGEQIKGLNALLLENAKSLHDMRQNVTQMMDDLKQNTEYITGLTRTSIEKMDASAQTILNAAEKFGEAGQVMNAQISHSHSLSRHMMESGMALNASAQTLSQVVSDYGQARESIASLVSTLQASVKEIDQKVTINKSLVEDMQKVSDRLKEVQGETDEYLHKVSDVLSSGFSDFGKSVHDNLDRSTSAFHTSMSNSVELISVQMRNLTAALQDLPELLRKPA